MLMAVGIASVAFSAVSQNSKSAGIEGVRRFLEEFSLVADRSAAGEGKEVFSTRLMDHPDADTYILVYERTQYDEADSTTYRSRQMINYTFALGDLDPDSVAVREWAGPLSDRTYWFVSVGIRASTEFVPYSNLVEEALEDGTVDVTTSRGKARSLALGYFSERGLAAQFAERVGALLGEGQEGS